MEPSSPSSIWGRIEQYFSNPYVLIGMLVLVLGLFVLTQESRSMEDQPGDDDYRVKIWIISYCGKQLRCNGDILIGESVEVKVGYSFPEKPQESCLMQVSLLTLFQNQVVSSLSLPLSFSLLSPALQDTFTFKFTAPLVSGHYFWLASIHPPFSASERHADPIFSIETEVAIAHSPSLVFQTMMLPPPLDQQIQHKVPFLPSVQFYLQDIVPRRFRRSHQQDDFIEEVEGRSNDLNAGFGGSYIYLQSLWTTNKSEAISSMTFIRCNSPLALGIVDTPDLLLQEDKAGDFRYLRFERSGDHRITSIKLWRTSNAASHPLNRGWKASTSDLNDHRGHDFLYLCWLTD